MRGFSLAVRQELWIAAAAGVSAILLGALVARSPILAMAAVGALGVGVATVRFGALALAGSALMLLPWLVILESIVPPVLGTFTAAVATGALIAAVLPLRFESSLVPGAAAGFGIVVLCHAVFATDGEQMIQAAKYLVFPAIALAVTSEGGKELVPSLRVPLLGSCLAAMGAHLLIIAAGLGEPSDYYGIGEKVGLAREGPHPLALLSVIIASAGLTVRTAWLQPVAFLLGAIPAALTAVRSALLGLVIALAVFLWQSRTKGRVLLVLGAVAAAAVLTGIADVTTARFQREAGEFSSFSSAGSGRGEIWSVALNAWDASGPLGWIFGTGLQSIADFELRALGEDFFGHSDLIEVLVELGFVGFVTWAALWVGLLRSKLSAIVLLPILTFGLVNGSLDYVPTLTVGIVLAAACVRSRSETEFERGP